MINFENNYFIGDIINIRLFSSKSRLFADLAGQENSRSDKNVAHGMEGELTRPAPNWPFKKQMSSSLLAEYGRHVPWEYNDFGPSILEEWKIEKTIWRIEIWEN